MADAANPKPGDKFGMATRGHPMSPRTPITVRYVDEEMVAYIYDLPEQEPDVRAPHRFAALTREEFARLSGPKPSPFKAWFFCWVSYTEDPAFPWVLRSNVYAGNGESPSLDTLASMGRSNHHADVLVAVQVLMSGLQVGPDDVPTVEQDVLTESDR